MKPRKHAQEIPMGDDESALTVECSPSGLVTLIIESGAYVKLRVQLLAREARPLAGALVAAADQADRWDLEFTDPTIIGTRPCPDCPDGSPRPDCRACFATGIVPLHAGEPEASRLVAERDAKLAAMGGN